MKAISALRRSTSLLAALGFVVAGLGVAPVASAHDDIAGSVPAHQSQLDDPISEVTIDFGKPVDGVELALVGPDDGELPGDVVIVSDTVAKLEFDELTVQGEYIVRYLAEEEGHLLGGAISFVYGSESAGGVGAVTWVFFGFAAALILAVGVFLTLRRSAAAEPVADVADVASVESPV